ncbi:MAG: hypothetical protein ACN4GR_11305 [Arenicellales bacterium]
MGLLSYVRDKRIASLSQSTASGVGKDVYTDWVAITEEQGGYYSALTISKTLHGVGLAFRCKTSDQKKMICLSISDKAEKYFFRPGNRYKIRVQFENSIVIYTYMRAYKQRHATIIDIMDDFTHNIFDSEKLKLQYLGDSGKKITMKFSLKGSAAAINSTIARAKQHKEEINT